MSRLTALETEMLAALKEVQTWFDSYCPPAITLRAATVHTCARVNSAIARAEDRPAVPEDVGARWIAEAREVMQNPDSSESLKALARRVLMMPEAS